MEQPMVMLRFSFQCYSVSHPSASIGPFTPLLSAFPHLLLLSGHFTLLLTQSTLVTKNSLSCEVNVV